MDMSHTLTSPRAAHGERDFNFFLSAWYDKSMRLRGMGQMRWNDSLTGFTAFHAQEERRNRVPSSI